MGRAALALACVALLMPARSHAGLANDASGQAKFAANCQSCHPNPANNPLDVLTGALKTQLQLRANGTIAHGGGTFPFNTFSAADFNNVAAYLASIDPRVYRVQGWVRSNAVGVANVQISITSAYNADDTLLTDSTRNFKQTGMRPGECVVTPSKGVSFVFTPTTRSIAMSWTNLIGGTNSPQQTAAQNGSLSNVNFAATYDPIDITGFVRPGGEPGSVERA